MIPYDFIYCKPDSLQEAAAAYTQLHKAEEPALYYGGGSEIITMSRAGSIRPGAVIDIKNIPECLALERDGEKLVIGAANTLNRIKESKLFPLLGTACGRVADHTNQCRITLGGNICGTIIYREASLPLLLSDAELLLYGPDGMRTEGIQRVFHQRMCLKPGEFVAQVHIPVWALHAPYAHIKKTTQERIDYPLVNVTALYRESKLRAAFSGLCAFPFRSAEAEDILNDTAASPQARAGAVAALLSEKAHADVEGSGAYRLFVLKNTILHLLETWEHNSLGGMSG